MIKKTQLEKQKRELVFRRLGFYFLCLSATWASSLVNLSARDLKIAVMGDGKKACALADAVTAAVTEKGVFSAFERQSLEKIIAEHELGKRTFSSDDVILLSRFVHADFFVLIKSGSVKNKTVPSGVVVFDARTGARLLDKGIPENTAEASAFVTDELRDSLKNSGDKISRKLISVLSVRNAGVPEKYNYALANIAAETERVLAASKDVAVLERANLSIVNSERDLTKEIYKLSPSACLLDFEASPGASPENVILNAYVLNTSGVELAKFRFEDCVKKPEETAKELVVKLSEFFSVQLPEEAPSSREEAARFFKEYKYSEQAGHWETAGRKIEAAVALNPKSPSYRRELAYFIARKSVHWPKGIQREARLAAMISSTRKMIEMCKEIREEFPDYKAELYNPEDLASAFFGIFANKNSLTERQKAEARELAELWRPLYCAEMRRIYCKFDLSDGINTLEEMKKFQNFLFSSSRDLHLYLDGNSYINAYFESLEQLLRYGTEFAIKNPDIIRKLSYSEQALKFSFYYLPVRDGSLFGKIFNEKLKNSPELVETMKNHPVPAVRFYGCVLELIRNAVLNDYDKEAFEKGIDIMLEKLGKMDEFKHSAEIIKGPFGPAPFEDFFIFSHRELYKAYLKGFIRLCRDLKKLPDRGIIINLSVCDKDKVLAEQIEETAPEIIAWTKPYNGDGRDMQSIYTMKDYCTHWSNKLDKNNPEHKKALGILNPPKNIKINVERIPLPVERMDASAMYEGRIYMISREDWRIYEFNPSDNACKPMLKATSMIIPPPDSRTSMLIYVNEKYFIVSGLREIHAIKRDGETEYVIKDLPCDNVNAVTMMDGRIYAFLGHAFSHGFSQVAGTVLFSCLPDGSDRKLHISTMRSEKLNFFDRQKPFRVNNLFGDENKKRLLFACETPLDGLWEFNPETGEEKRLIEVKYSSVWGMRIDSILYIALGPNRNSYYTFDMTTDKAEFIFLEGEASKMKKLKVKPSANSDIPVNPPFFTRGGQIWFSDFKIVYAELSNISDFIVVPDLSGIINHTPVYPHSDGVSALALTEKVIYKMTPVKQK